MDRYPQHEVILDTPGGIVCVRAFCTAGEILAARFTGGFSGDDPYRPLCRPEVLARSAEDPDTNVVLALADDRVVGYGGLWRPRAGDRWSMMPEVMEVGAIETALGRRAHGIARAVLGLMVGHPRIEERVTIMVGYTWAWDLQGCGLDPAAYRRLMVRLFDPFGFREHATNEPNLCLKPDNLFLARIGAEVTPEARQRFKWLCYGIKESA
jgi:acetoin utilization protein AcuA